MNKRTRNKILKRAKRKLENGQTLTKQEYEILKQSIYRFVRRSFRSVHKVFKPVLELAHEWQLAIRQEGEANDRTESD
jgi:hypothetical protein